ncbi:MAG: DUF5915 domain-containing protein [Acidobacteriota bacterium]|nr:DUF5915 domain-containing protein [Acidobacteriota bacterium]
MALDTALTPELIAEGRAREIVNRVQAARKSRDLDYADRIAVRYATDDELAKVVIEHGDWIAGETLATGLERLREPTDDLEQKPIDGLPFSLAVERVP